MQRSSIIATVIAAGGILVAGSVASVAVINAASLTPHDSETVSVVAAGAPNTSSTESTGVLAVDGAGADEATPEATPATTPELAVEELPELPDVADPATVSRTIVVQQYVAPTRTPAPTREPQSDAQSNKPKRPSHTASASPSASASPAATAEETAWISADAARDIVLTATNGGVVKSVEKTTRGEYSAWAVHLVRHDGSIVTGYVEASSGVLFDWVVNQDAPAPTAQPTTSGGGGSGSADDHSDDDHSDDDDDD